jgi:hypothetical protein
MSESVTLHVDNVHAEATMAVKSRAALSASTPDLISIHVSITPATARRFINSCKQNFTIKNRYADPCRFYWNKGW